MARERLASEWEQTSAVLAMIHNVNVVKGEPVRPSRFNPYRRKQAASERLPRVGIEALREAFGLRAKKASE